jgi:hypothetical protein
VIKSNLLDDFQRILLGRLTREGYQADSKRTASLQLVCLLYLTALRRAIESKPRTVQYSREFVCPPEHRAGLTALELRIIAGESVLPFLSKGLQKRLHEEDMLFNDWGIHHFHLGPQVEASGYVARTDYVLLARVTDSKVYFVEIVPHPRGRGWAQCRAMNLIHSNWPESLADCVALGFAPSGEPTTDDLVATLRSKNATCLFETTDGTVYFPPGRGITASGVGLEVVQVAHYWIHCVEVAETSLHSAETQIRARAAEEGIVLGEPFEVTLYEDQGALTGLVVGTRMLLSLGRLTNAVPATTD